MCVVAEDKIKQIGEVLLDVGKPLKARFRALFSLRNIPGPVSIACIGAAFADSSALLKHELAYCLGQMQDANALPILCRVLEDKAQEPIVRHEAAEALGAIGSQEAVDILKKHSNDGAREVAETCRLALDRLQWLLLHREDDSDSKSPDSRYNCVDPTPPSKETSVSKLEETLLNDRLSMFERYGAMFALRNMGTDDSALVLTKGLKTDSALFSHEIAFVLGQLQKEVSVPALVDCLGDVSQNEMVRHECAEALGAIATEQCFDVLRKYLNDDKRVVRESCEIALDMCEYELGNDFQYALV